MAKPTEKQKIFNRNKPYGTITGHDPDLPVGAKYEQNGMMFDHNGLYLSGDYQPAGVTDVNRDLADENERLRAELAAAKGEKGIKVQDAKQALDRTAIITQLNAKNIKFPKTGTTEHLYKLLQDATDQEAA